MKRIEKLQKRKSPNRIINQRTKEERAPILRGKLYIFLFFLLLTSLLYLIFLSGIFSLNEVQVSGYQNSKKINEIVNEVADNSLIKNNIIFINSNYIKDIIEGDPVVKKIKIKKRLPNIIKIEIEESKPELIWISAGENFLVDGGGYVIDRTDEINYNSVYDGSNIEVSLGERVASPTFIKFINNVNDNFETVTGVKVNRITIFDVMSDVHLLSSDSWTVYLDATKDAKSQIENLNRVLIEARKNGRKLEYIDMRLDNRIYYK